MHEEKAYVNVFNAWTEKYRSALRCFCKIRPTFLFVASVASLTDANKTNEEKRNAKRNSST